MSSGQNTAYSTADVWLIIEKKKKNELLRKLKSSCGVRVKGLFVPDADVLKKTKKQDRRGRINMLLLKSRLTEWSFQPLSGLMWPPLKSESQHGQAIFTSHSAKAWQGAKASVACAAKESVCTETNCVQIHSFKDLLLCCRETSLLLALLCLYSFFPGKDT